MTDAELNAAAAFLRTDIVRLNLKKHGRWGKPHARKFWLDVEGDEVLIK